ncbi:hypothetical protein ACVXG7_24220 [Enterobacter hormaechei]
MYTVLAVLAVLVVRVVAILFVDNRERRLLRNIERTMRGLFLKLNYQTQS